MIEYKCKLGSSILDHYKKIANLAKTENKIYYFEGNGIIFIADKDSDELLAEKYLDMAYTYYIKVIGPDAPMMTEEYKAEKEKLNADKNAKRMQEQKELDEKRKKNRKEVEEITKNVVFNYRNESRPDPEIVTDFYSKTAYDYAINLGKLLQVRKYVKGYYTKEDIDECEKKLDYLDITGYQHGFVVSFLEEFWGDFSDIINPYEKSTTIKLKEMDSPLKEEIDPTKTVPLKIIDPIKTSFNDNVLDCCKGCPNHPSNGGTGMCNCALPYMNMVKYTTT